MVIVWTLRGNIIRIALCWIVWHNVHNLQQTYVSSSYRSIRLGLSHWDPYAVHRVVLVGFKPDLWRPTGFLQCFDTVGLVIWPVKIVPEMTYNVLSGTLNPTHSLTHLTPLHFKETRRQLGQVCWSTLPYTWWVLMPYL